MSNPTRPNAHPGHDKSERGKIREMLVPQYLIKQMNESERIGLEFLIDCLENTSACSIPFLGTISTKIDDEIEISLDVEQTVIEGLRKGREARWGALLIPDMWRLPVYVSSNRGTSKQFRPICVAALVTPEIPCTDVCASFVLSAETGDLTQIGQVSRAIRNAIAASRREEHELLIRIIEEELDRVMALSWNEIVCEHEIYSDDSQIREVCADEVREAFLQPDSELDWTGGLPGPEKISQRVLSRFSWKKIDGRIDTD